MKSPKIHCAHTGVWPLDKFKPHPQNPNRHPKDQIKLLATIIQAQGWRAPITVSKRSGYVTKGHGRLEAAILGDFEIAPVDHQDYPSEEAEIQDMIADNRLAELSDRDDDAIGTLLKGLDAKGAVTLTGYDQAAIDKLLGRVAEPDATADGEGLITQAKALQKKWKTRPNQLWQLGRHRILCGDCTHLRSWEYLLGREKAQLNYTDPPYGVSYQDAAGTEIANDKLKQDALAKMLRESLRQAVRFTKPDAAFYIWHASATRRDFEHARDQVGLLERQYITWVKDSFALGRADYHWQTEPAFYAEKAGQRAKWYGDRTQGTVWRIAPRPDAGDAMAIANGILLTDGLEASLFLRATAPKAGGKTRHVRVLPGAPVLIADKATSTAWEVTRDARKDYLHPTQKPAALARIAILNSTAPGDIVVDQFSGSGSTLVACETTGRAARAMELAPEFVAVAIERWSKIAGAEPQLLKK